MGNVSTMLNGKSQLNNFLRYWPFLFGPAAIVYVYLTKSLGLDEWCSRRINEVLALPLVGISVFSFGMLAYKTRNELCIAMTFLCAAFFCREWHFMGASEGAYVAIAVFVVWFLIRRKHIDKLINGRPIKIWLLAAASCFLLSQIIARRVFAARHLGMLPYEEQYHISLEETLETAGHVLVIFASLFAWGTYHFKVSQKQTNGQSAELTAE